MAPGHVLLKSKGRGLLKRTLPPPLSKAQDSDWSRRTDTVTGRKLTRASKMRAETLNLVGSGCLPHGRVRWIGTTRLLINSKLGEMRRQKYGTDEE
jgi:hypothetical protein